MAKCANRNGSISNIFLWPNVLIEMEVSVIYSYGQMC